MSTIAKVFVVLNLVLAVAFLGAAATFLGYVDSYRGKFDTEKQSHENTRKTKDDLIAERDTRIAKLTSDLAGAQTERTSAVERGQQVSTSYAELKAAYDTLLANQTRMSATHTVANETIRTLTEQKDAFQKDAAASRDALRAAQEEKNAAVRSMNQAQLDLDNTRATVRELEQKLSACEEARARLAFDAEAKARGGGGTGTAEPQPFQTAKVTASDPRSNIVVISIGSEDGVKVGYRYIVSRGDSYVGTIEVTSTESKQSAARAIADLRKSDVRVGDDVASR